MKKELLISQVYVNSVRQDDMDEIMKATAHMPKDDRFNSMMLMVLQHLCKMTSSVVTAKRILQLEHNEKHSFLSLHMKTPLDDTVFLSISIARGTRHAIDCLNGEFAEHEYKNVFSMPVIENTTVIDRLPFVSLRKHLREFVQELARGTMGFSATQDNIWRHCNKDDKGIFKALRDYPATDTSAAFNITIQAVFAPETTAEVGYLMTDDYRTATMN